MKKYDLILIGAGSGLRVSSAAAREGKKVAIIEPGPMGGTCLNHGCIPSKMLIHTAEVANIIRESKKLGIEGELKDIHFKEIIERVSSTVDADAEKIEEAIGRNENMMLYKTKAKFSGKKELTLESGEVISADTIVIAAGTHTWAPPIDGLDSVEYLTSKTALRLKEFPKSMIIVGGGIIAAELANFYGSLGCEITIIERNPGLLGRVDREVSNFVTEKFQKRFNVLLNRNTVKIAKGGAGVMVTVSDLEGDNEEIVEAEQLLMAVGRRSNAPDMDPDKTDLKLDERGFIEVDDRMRTSVDGIWALGDIAGKWGLKHKANVEADVVTKNAVWGEDATIDYQGMPYAIFTSPQVAVVGKTEEELKDKDISYKVGRYLYKNTGMGLAFMDEDSFVKVLVGEDDSILGAHIVGPEASTLIHEVALAMANNLKAAAFRVLIIAHPALSEVVQRAFLSVK